MRRWGVVLAVAGIVVAGTASVALAASVTIENFTFSPSTVTINAGESVTWTNNDAAAHTATANDGSFDTGTLNQGGSQAVSFDTAGSFAYHCSFHSEMTGTVVVQGAGGGGGGVPQTATRLPILIVAGAVLLGAGIWLARRRTA